MAMVKLSVSFNKWYGKMFSFGIRLENLSRNSLKVGLSELTEPRSRQDDE